jgi:ribosomal protein S9
MSTHPLIKIKDETQMLFKKNNILMSDKPTKQKKKAENSKKREMEQ